MNDFSSFLKGVNQKDGKAWQQLYRYFYASLCNYSSKIINDTEVAEDVVQNCLVRLYDSDFNFSDIKAITAYLYRSVYHHSLNVIRNKKSSEQIHRQWITNVIEQADEEEGVFEAFEEEVTRRFYLALNSLPEQQREILLRALKGEKVKDIARRLQVSENTIKTQKKRAYQALRKSLGDTLILAIIFLYS